MIRHRMPLMKFNPFLATQISDYTSDLLPQFAIDLSMAVFRDEHQMIICSPTLHVIMISNLSSIPPPVPLGAFPEEESISFYV